MKVRDVFMLVGLVGLVLILTIAEKYAECDNFLYLGRLFNFPTALEGALRTSMIVGRGGSCVNRPVSGVFRDDRADFPPHSGA